MVPGPLAPFADGLRQDLAGRGYALDTVTDHVHLLADLSGWLAGGGLAAADLTAEAAAEFLRARLAAGHCTGVTARALAPALGYLRSVQAATLPGQPVPGTPLEELLGAYRQYLLGERGVSAGTVTHYLRYARAFLAGIAFGDSMPPLRGGRASPPSPNGGGSRAARPATLVGRAAR